MDSFEGGTHNRHGQGCLPIFFFLVVLRRACCRHPSASSGPIGRHAYYASQASRPLRSPARAEAPPSPFPGRSRSMRARRMSAFLGRLYFVLAMPSPEPFPTDLRQLARRRNAGLIRPRSLTDPLVEVSEAGVATHHMDRRLDEDTSQPRRSLSGDLPVITLVARLSDSRGKPGVSAHLVSEAESFDLAQLADNH
jgi:hypothetical protein